ncbi:MAG: hypothetical protein AAF989_01380 [Planctomycetota bacterium]
MSNILHSRSLLLEQLESRCLLTGDWFAFEFDGHGKPDRYFEFNDRDHSQVESRNESHRERSSREDVRQDRAELERDLGRARDFEGHAARRAFDQRPGSSPSHGDLQSRDFFRDGLDDRQFRGSNPGFVAADLDFRFDGGRHHDFHAEVFAATTIVIDVRLIPSDPIEEALSAPRRSDSSPPSPAQPQRSAPSSPRTFDSNSSQSFQSDSAELAVRQEGGSEQPTVANPSERESRTSESAVAESRDSNSSGRAIDPGFAPPGLASIDSVSPNGNGGTDSTSMEQESVNRDRFDETFHSIIDLDRGRGKWTDPTVIRNTVPWGPAANIQDRNDVEAGNADWEIGENTLQRLREVADSDSPHLQPNDPESVDMAMSAWFSGPGGLIQLHTEGSPLLSISANDALVDVVLESTLGLRREWTLLAAETRSPDTSVRDAVLAAIDAESAAPVAPTEISQASIGSGFLYPTAVALATVLAIAKQHRSANVMSSTQQSKPPQA